jgi:hypothetical protein
MRANINRNVILLIISVIMLTTVTIGCTPATSTAKYTSIATDQYSSTVISRYGLSLTLSLNSTTYHPGEQVTVTINEMNILPIRNKIHAADGRPIAGLTLSPCGTFNYPFGISILQGYYDAKDVGDITPLQLFDPNAFPLCPVILAAVYYTFQPWSNIATIYTGYDSQPWSTNLTAQVTSAGFWVGGCCNATFSNFTPGIYTIVGGDEWGALVVLHFTVT